MNKKTYYHPKIQCIPRIVEHLKGNKIKNNSINCEYNTLSNIHKK